MPYGIPIPPSPETSHAILAKFSELGIQYVPDRLISALDPERKVAILDDKSELPYDLFMGIPKHCVPAVVAKSGMTEGGWIPVDSLTLKTKFPNVYAIGDVTSVGTPKAGVFSEGAARTVAAEIIAELNGAGSPPEYDGEGTCYIEFGKELVGRVDVKFISGVAPTGKFYEPCETLVSEKQHFGSSRREKWFGLRN